MRQMTIGMPTIKDLFLSHSHADKSFVHQLANDCEQRGVTVWVDEAELLIGDSLIQKIQQAIDRTRFFALVVSDRSIDSEWVQKELEQALETEISSKSVKVLPIFLGGVDRLPGFLRSKLYADFSGWPHNRHQYETSLNLLVHSISEWKLKDTETQFHSVVPEDIYGNETSPSKAQLAEARSIATRITDLEDRSGISSDTETYYRIGNLHFIERQFEKALEFYDRAINLMPGHLKGDALKFLS